MCALGRLGVVKSVDEPSEFRPANEVLGDEGRVLFESFVDALLYQSGITSSHREDAAQSATLKVATGAVSELLIGFEGASYECPWDGTVTDAHRIIRELLPYLVDQVKADRGRLGGHHPWDD